jgi:hypothetical protein
VPIGPQELLTAAPHLVAGVLRASGEARLRVLGGSMYPVLRSGETITVQACEADTLEIGDLLLVRDGDRLFAHRLVARTASTLVLRGDSHWHADPPRPLSSLLGRIVAITRDGVTVAAPFACAPLDRLRGLLFSEWTRMRASIATLTRRATTAV